MTYCVAIKLSAGLVFCSDSRTNAGIDQVSIYSKMYTWGLRKKRQFVLLSAGNLATTQAVANQITKQINERFPVNLFTVSDLNEAADYVGRVSAGEQIKHLNASAGSGFNPEATFIFGGQISGYPQDIFLIYPQGNHIQASRHAPFLQLGETKYGKPILDRIIRPDTPIDDAVSCALVSMDSTMRSNVSVGPPIELVVYENDSFYLHERISLTEDNPYLLELKHAWDEKVVKAFREMPKLNLQRLDSEPLDG
ncbi:MAG: peptidase [Methylococcales bacterium]